MDTKPKLAIVLSTYNGEQYLAEQLDSLLAQSWPNFVIVVRDDGSKDSTVDMLKAYAGKSPEKFHLLLDQENQGASASFSSAMEYVLNNKEQLGLEKAYMLFCDQDDIWVFDKVYQEMQAMLTLEQASPDESIPVLVHSDLTVVSENNSVIAASFIDYQGLLLVRNSFANLVISNLVTGCTALINEPLAQMSGPVPEGAIMHDWWLALVASAFGKVKFVNKPLLNYRQHDNNTIGAQEFVKKDVLMNPLSRLFRKRAVDKHLLQVADQAIEFSKRFDKQLSLKQKIGLWFAGGMKSHNGIVQRIYYRFALLF